MRKILIVLYLLGYTVLSASNPIWSKDTQPLSETKKEKIVEAFKNSDNLRIDFTDDLIPKRILYDFKENIFVIGLAVGGQEYSETLSNRSGSKTLSLSANTLEISLAKDFTLWHEDYTQPTRLYILYSITQLDSDIAFSTTSFGLRENMYYWSLYKTDSYNIYPTISIELGQSSLKREEYSISGYTAMADIGITYIRDANFEYFLNFDYSSINWKHPIDGVDDKMGGFGLSFGLNYKLMYGDF